MYLKNSTLGAEFSRQVVPSTFGSLEKSKNQNNVWNLLPLSTHLNPWDYPGIKVILGLCGKPAAHIFPILLQQSGELQIGLKRLDQETSHKNIRGGVAWNKNRPETENNMEVLLLKHQWSLTTSLSNV